MAIELPNALQSLTPVSDIVFKVLGSEFGANSPDFNFTVKEFSGVNADGRSNVVTRLGWNILPGGGREDTGEAALAIEFEQHYQIGGVAGFEWHLAVVDEAGVIHRPIGSFFPKNGGAGSGLTFGVEYVSFTEYDLTVQRLKFDWADDAIYYDGDAISHYFNNNNYAPLKQRNAANSSYLNLPYYDSDDRILLGSNAYVSGAVPSTGAFAGVLFALNASAVASGDSMLRVFAPAHTGWLYATDVQAAVNGTLFSRVLNTNSAASGAHAVLQVAANGASAGDPFVQFEIAGVTTWVAGADNSDSDKFKVSQNNTLGTNDYLVIDTSGNIKTVGYVDLTEVSAPSAPPANCVRLYPVDNGSGKTRLMALFATGAAQLVAEEP